MRSGYLTDGLGWLVGGLAVGGQAAAPSIMGTAPPTRSINGKPPPTHVRDAVALQGEGEDGGAGEPRFREPAVEDQRLACESGAVEVADIVLARFHLLPGPLRRGCQVRRRMLLLHHVSLGRGVVPRRGVF